MYDGKLDDIWRVVHVTSAAYNQVCQECPLHYENDGLASMINHYIQKHRYTLLHIGAEADVDSNGKVVTHSVAILGRTCTSQEKVDNLARENREYLAEHGHQS